MIKFTVFSKPWKLSIPELGKHVRSLGFDGVEYPIRPGYAVNPDNMQRELPAAVRTLKDSGLTIDSVAGPLDEKCIAACAEAGVPLIRAMAHIPAGKTYLEVEAEMQKKFDELLPALKKNGVRIGVQNHCDDFIGTAPGLLRLLDRFDPKFIGVIWDAAHSALNGEAPDLGLSIVWPRVMMVNLKNAYWKLKNGPEAPFAEWEHYWTTGRRGLSPWHKVAEELKRRQFSGTVCLTAEYSDHVRVDELAAEDLQYARSLFK